MSLRVKKFLIIFAGVTLLMNGAMASSVAYASDISGDPATGNPGPMENLTGQEQTSNQGKSELEMIDCNGVKGILISCWAPIIAYGFLYKPAQLFLMISGELFDFILSLSIDREFIDQPFVNQLWEIVRDFSNMVFIFVLLYTGIQTMFGLGGAWQKKIATIVILAIIINFSMFFSKIIIDAGNTLAVGVYSGMGVVKTGSTTNQPHKRGGSSAAAERDISSVFVERFRPQQFSKLAAENRDAAAFIFLIAAVVSGYIAWVLIKAAFMFIGRIIAFWFYIIISPFALISMVLPKGNIFDTWLYGLINQAMVAPVFLFLVYLIMFAVQGGTSASGILTNFGQETSGGVFNNIFISIVLTGMIIYAINYALKVATGMAGEFGKIGADIGNKALGVAGMVAGGGTALVGSKVIGGLAQRALTSGAVKGLEEKVNNGTATFAERQMFKAAVRATDFARNATLDFRNIPIPGVFGGGTVGKATGLGEGGRQGYREKEEARRKKKEEREPSRVASEARIAEMTTADAAQTAREAQEKKEVAAERSAAERQARRDVGGTHPAAPHIAAARAAARAPGAARVEAERRENARLDRIGAPAVGTPLAPGYQQATGLHATLEKLKTKNNTLRTRDVAGIAVTASPVPGGRPLATYAVGASGALKHLADYYENEVEDAEIYLANNQPPSLAYSAAVRLLSQAKKSKNKADKDLKDFNERDDNEDKLQDQINKLSGI